MKKLTKKLLIKWLGQHYIGGLLLIATFLLIAILILLLDQFGIINLTT